MRTTYYTEIKALILLVLISIVEIIQKLLEESLLLCS